MVELVALQLRCKRRLTRLRKRGVLPLTEKRMKAIELDRELRDLVSTEEVLAYFDFVLPLGAPGGTRDEVEGLCKVSRPRARRSHSTYLSLMFIIDAQDAAVQTLLRTHFGQIDWAACAAPGIDCVLAIPHREPSAGLFLKEVDVYLDREQAPSAKFLRDVLQPALARSARLVPGELTVWEETAEVSPQQAAAGGETLLSRLRRLAGGS
jgi:hypothetical protein